MPLLVFIFRLDDSSLQSTSRKTLNLNLQKTPGRAERENNENASTLLMSPAVTRYRTALSMTPTSIPSTLHYESKSLLMKGAEILYQLLKREEDGVPLSKVNLKIGKVKVCTWKGTVKSGIKETTFKNLSLILSKLG